MRTIFASGCLRYLLSQRARAGTFSRFALALALASPQSPQRTRSLVLARLSNLPSFLAWLRRGYLSSSTPRGGKFLMKLSLARARARSDESQGSQGWCSRLFVFLPRCQAAARENRQSRSHALCGQVYCLLAAAIRLHGNESLIRARGKSSLCN